MCREVVSLASAPGQVVCDPFMGSGSTGVAAVSLSRYFIGSEIIQEWYNVAECRIRESASEIRQDNANENGNVKRRGSKDLETSIKQENFRKVHLLSEQGYSKSQIAQTLKIDWKTVQRYLAMSEQEFLQSSSYCRDYDRVLDDYDNVLRDKLRREPKLSCAQIYRWFREQYPEVAVSQKTMYNYITALRAGKK